MASRKEKVLVTGAGGFIGSHVVRILLDQGYQVRGAELFPERCTHLTVMINEGKALEMVQADLLKAETWAPAMQGCTYVIHMASVVAMDCPEKEAEERMIRPAREGTLNVLRAAAEAGVKRVVLTSSLGAIGAPGDLRKRAAAGKPLDSSMWTDLTRATPYCRSKTIGEQTAWDFVKSPEAKGMQLVVMNPGVVVGPALSAHLHESMKLSIRLLKPRSGAMPDVMLPLVHVLDVAEAHINALKAPEANGKRFLLIKEVSDMHALGCLINPVFEPLGYPVPTRKLPYWLTRLIAFIDTPLYRSLDVCGLKPDVDTQPAQEVLGVLKREVNGAVVDMSVDAIALGHVEKTEAFAEWHARHYKPSAL